MVITQYNYLDDTEVPTTLRSLVAHFGTQLPPTVSESMIEAAQRIESMIDYIETVCDGDDAGG